MSKNKSKSDRTKISRSIASLDETGAGRDITINVSVHRGVEITLDGSHYPFDLNSQDARTLGKALLKAANRLDGGR